MSLGPAMASGSENSRAATACVAVRSLCKGRATRSTTKLPRASPIRPAAPRAAIPRTRVRSAMVSSAPWRRWTSATEAT